MSGGQLPVVEFRDVEKTFAAGTPKAFTALAGLSFAIEDLPGHGEFIAVLGPSGCGKSTMLNLIAGFDGVAPPTAGEVLVRGVPVTGPGRDRGMIFQRYSSFPHLTVLQNVTFGLELNGRELGHSAAERRELARHWLARVGLSAHEQKYPHQLSGGQQQRVAIARSLVLKPRIILMDEPFSALDEPTRLDMQALILELWREIEATVFLVTHSIAEAVYLGDRIWIFTHAPGRIGREVRDEIPSFAGRAPIEAQTTPEFQRTVELVTALFQGVTGGAVPA
ncbi:MAG TPA: ABC transporter ATP-binding protein [Thermoanaerobaculia bacterium]|nr:ABC transporter ATP-binding protein [Thermoanaerobaculia bacterium]